MFRFSLTRTFLLFLRSLCLCFSFFPVLMFWNMLQIKSCVDGDHSFFHHSTSDAHLFPWTLWLFIKEASTQLGPKMKLQALKMNEIRRMDVLVRRVPFFLLLTQEGWGWISHYGCWCRCKFPKVYFRLNISLIMRHFCFSFRWGLNFFRSSALHVLLCRKDAQSFPSFNDAIENFMCVQT